MPVAPTAASASRRESRPNPHKRTYQACVACRAAKLRCDLGDPDAPHEPPCRRCLRTGRACAFGGVYRRKSREGSGGQSKEGSGGPRAEEGVEEGTPEGEAGKAGQGVEVGQVGPSESAEIIGRAGGNVPHPSIQGYREQRPPWPTSSFLDTSGSSPRVPSRAPTPRSQDFKFVRGETLENPADALRILAAAVEGEEPNRAVSPDAEVNVEPQQWNRWLPVREGLLTADEAAVLLNFYRDKINPTHPIVPVELFEPRYFGHLLREPVLLAAMIVTAARYLDLGLSYDPAEPLRSRVVQSKIVAWLLQRIGYITMGETSSRTVGTVEALLILSEWPPREEYLVDSALPETSTRKSNAAKVYDELSWTLIGLAVRIALELDLQNEQTYVNEHAAEWVNHRRHNTWIYCLSADRHASVRLNRASLVQEMSLRWWNLAAVFTRKENDETFPFPRPDMRWREGMGVAQLTHTIGLLQEMLYASPDLTAELIKTGRYASTLHRLKPELDSTWNDQLGDLPPMSVFDSDGDHFTQDELMEIRWRIEFDYVRLYGNAIAVRAAQDRLLRQHKFARTQPERLLQTSVIRLAEGSFVIEAVDAATSLVRCGVTMQRKGLLRYSPCRFFLRLVFASVFLMKAVAFGAVGQPEQEIVELQYQLIEAFRQASPDDQHVASHLAELLSRVFPSIPHQPLGGHDFRGPSAAHSDQPAALGPSDATGNAVNSSDNVDSSAGSSAHPGQLMNPWLGFDMNANTMNYGGGGNTSGSGGLEPSFDPLSWELGVVSGFGYDPSGIVSDIEQMLAAGDGQMPSVF